MPFLIKLVKIMFFILTVSAGQALAHEQWELSPKTKDALLHVVAHSIGNAMLREFDLPILGPEVDIADDFATVFIYLSFPERARSIISARARQHLADGNEPSMFSEYRNDRHRAGRLICLLYGQDPSRFKSMAPYFGLKSREARVCRDFSAEIGRSWRRIIKTSSMPPDARLTEVGNLMVADTRYARALATTEFQQDVYFLLSRIDWHSQITLKIDDCNGAATWSRNGRRITICDSYIERFEKQLSK